MSNSQPAGCLTVPAAGSGRPVLVLHAWWGLNQTMRAFCARLAESGFLAFAPDLYHGKVADTIEGAEQLMRASNSDPEQTAREIGEASRFLMAFPGAADSGLAVVGFSVGANFALDAASADPGHVRSVVLFYGTGGGDFSTSKAAYLGHFAENDPFEERGYVDELEESLRSAGRPVTFHHYAGAGHWFFEPDRTEAYDAAAAQLAWERTLAFLVRPAAA